MTGPPIDITSGTPLFLAVGRWRQYDLVKRTDTVSILLFLVIGLAAGVLSGLFGIGGGVLIVPALLLLTRMPPATATGTSLAALLLPVGALGAWQYYKHGNVNVVAALLIALGLAVGAYFGASYAQGMSPLALRRAFAIFLLLVAFRMWWGDERGTPIQASVGSPAQLR
jgi:uncharacterized membrane protein YfcA